MWRAKGLIIDPTMPSLMQAELRSFGYDLIEVDKRNDLYMGIEGHPDIQLCVVGSKVIHSPKLGASTIEKITEYGYTTASGAKLTGKYPGTVAYNVAIVGKYAIHNFDHTDPTLKKTIIEQGYICINVKQGYSKCSICIVDDNSIITSDNGIKKALEAYGIDVLLIESGGIYLSENYEGFIGGASGRLSGDTLYFTGNVEDHINFNNIKHFLRTKNVEIAYNKISRLTDYGSVILI